MFKKFFDTTTVATFSDQVVAELMRRLPPAEAERASKGDGKSKDRFETLLEQRVASLAASSLNVYQKARLGTILQDRLEAAGYPRDFSERLARDMVRRVAIAAATRAPT
jgi:hypothetical protein